MWVYHEHSKRLVKVWIINLTKNTERRKRIFPDFCILSVMIVFWLHPGEKCQAFLTGIVVIFKLCPSISVQNHRFIRKYAYVYAYTFYFSFAVFVDISFITFVYVIPLGCTLLHSVTRDGKLFLVQSLIQFQ